MSRNDAFLHTGMTSASFASPKEQEVKAKKRLTRDERTEQRQLLRPSAEIILNILDDERQMVIQELANLPVAMETSNENVKEVLMAMQRNLRFIDNVKAKLVVALREIPHE